MKSLNTIIIITYVHLYKLQLLLTFFLEVQTVDCVLYSYHGLVSLCQEIQIKCYVFTPLIFMIAMKCIHMEYHIWRLLSTQMYLLYFFVLSRQGIFLVAGGH